MIFGGNNIVKDELQIDAIVNEILSVTVGVIESQNSASLLSRDRWLE